MRSSGEVRGNGEGVCAESPDAAQRVWGFVANDIPDPRPCIDKCQELFFKRVVPQYDGSNFTRACQHLSGGAGVEDELVLRQLYCCDSLLCGVRIVEPSGQDPNVNSVINRCQNEYGGYIINDPGPPPPEFTCPLDTISRDEQGLPCERSTSIAPEILPNPSIDAGTMTVLTLDTESLPTMPPTPATGSDDPSSALPAQTSPPTSPAAGAASKLPEGAKAAIVVICVLLFLALVALALFYFRRRRKSSGYPPARSRHHIRHHVIPPTGSPTPLISPVGSAPGPPGTPLSPPPRLRERRMLSPLLGPSPPGSYKSVSIPGTPTAPPPVYSGFPRSPICAPTDHKLVPRNEEVYHGYGGSTTTAQDIGVAKTASISSVGSQPATTASGYSTTTASLQPTSPAALGPVYYGTSLSPMRPPRPHDSPLEIPDLVRPDPERTGSHGLAPSPPPKRALPPAPAGSTPFPSPGFQGAMQHRQHGDVGVAIGVVSHNPAQGVVLQPDSQDLCELTERCGKETRDSWGSWGGGGPGVILPSPAKRTGGGVGRADSPVMEEVDLERLGGRY